MISLAKSKDSREDKPASELESPIEASHRVYNNEFLRRHIASFLTNKELAEGCVSASEGWLCTASEFIWREAPLDKVEEHALNQSQDSLSHVYIQSVRILRTAYGPDELASKLPVLVRQFPLVAILKGSSGSGVEVNVRQTRITSYTSFCTHLHDQKIPVLAASGIWPDDFTISYVFDISVADCHSSDRLAELVDPLKLEVLRKGSGAFHSKYDYRINHISFDWFKGSKALPSGWLDTTLSFHHLEGIIVRGSVDLQPAVLMRLFSSMSPCFRHFRLLPDYNDFVEIPEPPVFSFNLSELPDILAATLERPSLDALELPVKMDYHDAVLFAQKCRTHSQKHATRSVNYTAAIRNFADTRFAIDIFFDPDMPDDELLATFPLVHKGTQALLRVPHYRRNRLHICFHAMDIGNQYLDMCSNFASDLDDVEADLEEEGMTWGDEI